MPMRVHQRGSAGSAIAVFAFAAGLCAQEPTFQVDVSHVEIPVRVINPKGVFVGDLSRNDFTIQEDGKPQTISDFRVVNLALPSFQSRNALKGASQDNGRQVAAPAAHLERDARTYLLVLDDLRLRAQYSPQLKRAGEMFIRNYVADEDNVSILSTGGAVRQDFTSDRNLLLATLARVLGKYDADVRGAALADEVQALSTLKTIEDVSRSWAYVKGRKAIIYLGHTIGCAASHQVQSDRPPPLLPIRQSDMSSEGEQGALGVSAPLCRGSIWETVREATQGDVAVYAVDVRGLRDPTWVSPKIDGRGGPDRSREKMSMVEGPRNPFDGIRVLAESTGGFVIEGTNDFAHAFERIVRENSSYYLLGYYSTNERADGTTRKTVVKVNRRGLTVSYRATYMAKRN